jgi:hypothetical protein
MIAGPRREVFDAVTTAETVVLRYGLPFSGGVRVAAGDVSADGVADIIRRWICAAGGIKVFDGRTGAELQSFSRSGFTGVSVAAALQSHQYTLDTGLRPIFTRASTFKECATQAGLGQRALRVT